MDSNVESDCEQTRPSIRYWCIVGRHKEYRIFRTISSPLRRVLAVLQHIESVREDVKTVGGIFQTYDAEYQCLADES